MRAELVPVGLLVLLTGVVAVGATRSSAARQALRDARTARAVVVTHADSLRGVTRKAVVLAGTGQSTLPAELRARVLNLAPGTYVNDILAGQDSVLYRWAERPGQAVRVYVAPASTAAAWNPAYPDMARGVFDEWSQAGFPLRFTFILDSATADILIRWIGAFPPEAGQRIGQTERVQTSAAFIERAELTIALHDSAGRILSPASVGGIVRHEVGHALGLNHAGVPTSVMYRQSATSSIGASDRATLRLLYLVPAGSLKD